jgi:hypothetical protein
MCQFNMLAFPYKCQCKRYDVSELVRCLRSQCHALQWDSRVPAIREYGLVRLTESEIESLTSYWHTFIPNASRLFTDVKRSETHVNPFSKALRRLWYSSSMRKATGPINQVLDRFKRFLLTLPIVSEARWKHVDNIWKLDVPCG